MPTPSQTGIETLFPIPFMQHRWDDSGALNAALARIILAREAAERGRTKSNVGGWQSGDDLPHWAGEPGQVLVRAMFAMVDHATNQVLGDRAGQVSFGWKVGMWANVNRAGQYNKLHLHPSSTWSGTYYVDPGDPPPKDNPSAGKISFLDPNGARAMSFLGSFLPTLVDVQPEAGLMILFPSYLLHSVHPYSGRRPRISIAFNVTRDPYP